MIQFSPLEADIVLDCDVDPKTRFKIRSLRFCDEEKIQAEVAKVGDVPQSRLRQLTAKWQSEGESAPLDADEEKDLNTLTSMRIANENWQCALGVTEIDCKAVSPEDVLSMLGSIPAMSRDKVRSELARRVVELGKPAPKSETPSE